MKIARTVLKGRGDGNVASLPDYPEQTPSVSTAAVVELMEH